MENKYSVIQPTLEDKNWFLLANGKIIAITREETNARNILKALETVENDIPQNSLNFIWK